MDKRSIIIKKCDCYRVGAKRQYTYNPMTGDPVKHDITVGVCWGTKEMDECSCDGDRTKCDFYPEVRENALKEQEPKFGEWISVEDRLPEKDEYVLCYSNKYGGTLFIGYRGWYSGAWMENESLHIGNVTHWMPLPILPKGE